MKHPESIYFEKLKEEICLRYRQRNPVAAEKIEEWSGKTIEGFQQDMQQEVKSTISVRWFYTHIKTGYEDKIPRTDVLDLLCRYVGYDNWGDFIAKKKEDGIVNEEPVMIDPIMDTSLQSAKVKHYVRMPLFMLGGLIVILVSVLWVTNRKESKVTCRFCFSDADIGTRISGSKIQVILLHKGESPQAFFCNDSGCFSVQCKPGRLSFIVNAEYYYPDTVVRTVTASEQPEMIMLKPDDYALMINIFSRSKVGDWEKRREQLQTMFTDDARIFQVEPGDERGMEIYNKKEFIDKLTMPIASLNNIEVVQTVYKNGRIAALRFIQKESKNQ